MGGQSWPWTDGGGIFSFFPYSINQSLRLNSKNGCRTNPGLGSFSQTLHIDGMFMISIILGSIRYALLTYVTDFVYMCVREMNVRSRSLCVGGRSVRLLRSVDTYLTYILAG